MSVLFWLCSYCTAALCVICLIICCFVLLFVGATSASMGSAAVDGILHVPSSPRSYSPPSVELSSVAPPLFQTPSPFADPVLFAQLEMFSNFMLPASFLRDIPLPDWSDLGFPTSSNFSPCILANLCLLSHGEAAGLPSPL